MELELARGDACGKPGDPLGGGPGALGEGGIDGRRPGAPARAAVPRGALGRAHGEAVARDAACEAGPRVVVGEREHGSGMATAGIIIGFVALAFWLVFFVVSLAASGSNG